MKKTIKYAFFGVVLALVTPAMAAPSVALVSKAVAGAVSTYPKGAPDVVAREVAKHPEMAGEIVKAAIKGSGANSAMIAKIVKAAMKAAPGQSKAIAYAAYGVAPDAKPEIEASYERSLKKRGLTIEGNPLDFPEGADGKVKITPGGEGGAVLVPHVPPVITPPSATTE